MSDQPASPSPLVVALQAFLRGLLRFLMIALILGLVAAAFYYALPLIYRELVMPVRETSDRLTALSQQLSDDRAAMGEQLKSIQTRLNQLETSSAAAGASVVEMQSSLSSLKSDLVKLQSALERLDQLEKDLKALDGRQGQTAGQLATLDQSLRAPGGKVDLLRREVEILKVMNLLTRAEVNLAQNNFGMARDDVLAARDILLVLRDTLSGDDRDIATGWISRLDLALANLPAFPVIAANDLEAAYQMLALGVQPPPPTPGPITPTPTPWETPTPTPTPWETPTVTPFFTITPEGTGPAPTFTPFVTATPTPSGP